MLARHGIATRSTAARAPARPGPRLPPLAHPLAALLPAALALGLLLALGILSLLAERRIVALHDEISRVGDPARAEVNEIQLALALEAAGTRGYLLEGDPRYAASHQRARARRRAALARLEGRVSSLGPEVAPIVARLDGELRVADALLDSLYAGQLSRGEYMPRLPAQQARFEVVTGAVQRIDLLVGRHMVDGADAAERAQRRLTHTTVALVLVALLAVALVARFGASYRALASREAGAHAASEAARAEAEERRQESERLFESRARLVRGFTHDVKNPLGAAIGYLELMRDGVWEPTVAASHARRNVLHALGLIEELLGFERAGIAEYVVRQSAVDLREMVREVAHDWSATAAAKGLSLDTRLPEECPSVDSDPDRVRQVLGNLVANAVRYTARGGVTVGVGTRAGGPESPQGWATIEVSDTGPGLSAEQRAGLFQEFSRLATSDGTRGSGVGLASSKRIAEALGGSIQVESEPGVGSRFTLLLPRRRATAGVAPAPLG